MKHNERQPKSSSVDATDQTHSFVHSKNKRNRRLKCLFHQTFQYRAQCSVSKTAKRSCASSRQEKSNKLGEDSGLRTYAHILGLSHHCIDCAGAWMKVEMTSCDNPKCNKVTDEEAYGWINAHVHWRGSGPTVKVEVCSPACLAAGVKEAERRQEYEEEEREYTYREAVRAAIIGTVCPTCAAQPGESCISLVKRIPAQQPHMPRVKSSASQDERGTPRYLSTRFAEC